MEMLERLERQSSAWPELKLAVLFGSQARGKARPRSDVDLGILLDPYSAELRFQVEARLGRSAGRPVDVVLLDDAPPLLRFEIAREGKLLFQREDHLWTDFKTKAMVDWWDWAPTHRMIAAGVIRHLREKVAHGQGDVAFRKVARANSWLNDTEEILSRRLRSFLPT
jgi:predicted nucleotidyltransferase